MDNTFTSNEVAALTGITQRQLQWWDERGIVVPARDGRRRLYSLPDLAEVAVICELRQRGFSLQRVRKVMRYLQRELGKRLVETVSASSEYHLLTDGKHIFLEDSARAVVDILKNSRQPMLTVCLSDTVQRIQTDVRVFTDRQAQAQLSGTAPSFMAAAAGVSHAALASMAQKRSASRTRKGRSSTHTGNSAS
ncbi:MAG TPA: MerR family transcriptional regulator [Clostridia bacterium]|nr:MerR family transcriptional regulator [Clostridia bacterium]